MLGIAVAKNNMRMKTRDSTKDNTQSYIFIHWKPFTLKLWGQILNIYMPALLIMLQLKEEK